MKFYKMDKEIEIDPKPKASRDGIDDPGLIDEDWLKESFHRCASYIWIN